MIRDRERQVGNVVRGQTPRCLFTIAKDQEERDIHADNGPKRVC